MCVRHKGGVCPARLSCSIVSVSMSVDGTFIMLRRPEKTVPEKETPRTPRRISSVRSLSKNFSTQGREPPFGAPFPKASAKVDTFQFMAKYSGTFFRKMTKKGEKEHENRRKEKVRTGFISPYTSYRLRYRCQQASL